MRRLQLIGTVAAAVVAGCAVAETTTCREQDARLVVELRAPSEVELGGEFTVELRMLNRSAGELTVHSHWFDPNLETLELRDADGALLANEMMIDLSAPRREDFVTLEAGGEWADSQQIVPEMYPDLRPGRHTLRVRYQNEYRSYYRSYPEEKLGDVDAWTGCLYSNSVALEVSEP